ncbi:DUF3237 family protein [Antricoccus suffuscus]|nr:DUF3237 family protein [Antricoccus suffuscus]
MTSQLQLVDLCAITIERGPRYDTGPGPLGRRVSAEAASVVVTGERLSGQLAGVAAADWATTADDGLTLVDSRMTIGTHDGALILITYTGRINDISKFPAEPVYVSLNFATGDPRYRWLVGIQAVAKGSMSSDGNSLEYLVYELR